MHQDNCIQYIPVAAFLITPPLIEGSFNVSPPDIGHALKTEYMCHIQIDEEEPTGYIRFERFLPVMTRVLMERR